MQLKTLQQQFARQLLAPTNSGTSAFYAHISSAQFKPEQLLSIYRNNFIISLTETLAATYPATLALTGESFFNAVARDFILQTPLAEGNVMHYGSGFSDYLLQHPVMKQLPYIADLAALEWQCDQLSLSATEKKRFNRDQFIALLALGAEHTKQLHLIANSTLTVIASPYPLAQIYNMVINADVTPVELNAPSVIAIFKNRNNKTALLDLNPDQHQLIQSCFNALPLSLVALHDPITLNCNITTLINAQAIVDFSNPPQQNRSI